MKKTWSISCYLLLVLVTMVPILAHATSPSVTTIAANAITITGATLNGTVDPKNHSTTVSFDYGPTIGYGSNVTASQSPLAANLGFAATVSANLAGLTCSTTYHFRVVGVNSSGTSNGGDLTFTTLACPPPTAPTATTVAASSLTATGATLNGTVSSNGAITTVTFDYGLTTGYGSSAIATQSPLVAGASGMAVSKAVSGLICNTLYHFQVHSVNSAGTTLGSDLPFTTAACLPTATTVAASSLSATGATLNGTVSSNGASTTVTFDYGLTTGYGSSATAAQSPLAAGANGTAVSATVIGLTCNTLYHFRVNSVNSSGTTLGSDLTFSTSTCPPFCSQPSNTPIDPITSQPLVLTCQCDTFRRAALNPSTIFGGNWVATTSGTTPFTPQIVSQGHMRLTENKGYESTAATVPGIFPAAGNYISVEFLHYAYNGNGADGIAVTLSDYAVTAQPGAFGGSLGYAQRTGVNGFAGGWIGVALDEYGNYQSATEGRIGGSCLTAACLPQSVGVRGSGSGLIGYPWLKGTANLTTVAPNVGIDNSASTSPSYGDYYQVIVDSRGNNGVNGPALVSVNRDTSGVGNAYSPLIPAFDAYAAATAVGYTQAPVPQNWQVSFTGSTGGSYNIHEIGGLRICAQTIVPTTGGTPGGFNAIDEANVRNDVNAVSGHLYTKLAGTVFTVKVAALNATNSGILTTYATSGNKTVTVKLFDDSVGTSCNASTAACSACSKPVVATQTMTFASTDTGFKQSGNFTVPAYANLIVQMSDGTTTGCSVDAFAVRPTGIASVTSTNATNTTTTGTPTFKAGSDTFSLTATTAGITTAITGNPSGYTGGLPKINANAVQGSTAAGVLAGSFAAATSGTSSATATGITFIYNEVGTFNLLGPDFTLTPTRIPGVYDDTWTAVDSGAKGDCISGTTAAAYSNTKDTNGKYGCNFGTSANTVYFGRFIPDHFDTVVTQVSGVPMSCPAGLTPTCPVLYNGIVYSGQPFSLTVTAMNASDLPTVNYSTATGFAKTTNLTAWGALGTTTAPTGAGALGVLSETAFVKGTLTETAEKYTFNTILTAPTNIYIRASDGEASSLRLLNPTTTSVEGGVAVVSGRINISNAHGSELLQLPIAVTVQYWNGLNYVTSSTDSVTSFAAGAVLWSNCQKLSATSTWPSTMICTPPTSVSPASVVFVKGAGSFILAKPGAGNTGSVDMTTNAPSYLPSNKTRATFGVYKGANQFIYLRENY